MTVNDSMGGLIGRAIAVIGAVLAGISLTQPLSDGSDISFWDSLDKTQYAILAVVVLTVLLVVLSLVAVAEIALLGAALTACFILGFYLLTRVEFEGLGRAWTLGIAGSAVALAGALIALVPMLAGRIGQSGELAFLPQSGTESGRRRSDRPTDAGAGGPVPGWYADPANQALLRYWDGLEWSHHTRSHDGGQP
jgi:hypothetical protein